MPYGGRVHGNRTPRSELGQPASTHALGDQSAFIFGDSTTDLQQQLIMWVLTHRSIQELDLAAVALELLD